MTKSILAALTALLLFSACQKDETIAPDAAQVSISISDPRPGQIFHNGDTVHIRARVSYPSELHGYEIRLSDSATGSVIHSVTEHVHSDSFSIDEIWLAETTQRRPVTLTLITTIDHEGNTARKDLPFTVVP